MTRDSAADRDLQECLESPDDEVRRRAAIVSDAMTAGVETAAARHGVTRRTASEWLRRYREHGTAALTLSNERQKRQSDLSKDILTAGLWMPTTKWSSRSIAESLGVSQSTVARVWRSSVAPNEVVEQLSNWTRTGSIRLIGMLISPASSVLVFSRTRSTRRVREGTVTRTSHRYQTVLGADLAREHIVDDGHAMERVADFERRIASRHDDPTDLLVMTSTSGVGLMEATKLLECTQLSHWLGLSSHLAGFHDEQDEVDLIDLENALRRWFKHDNGVFIWHAQETMGTLAVNDESEEAGSAARDRSTPERPIQDAIIAAIRNGIEEGRFTGGDIVTERFLAQQVNTSRGEIRSALRLLAIDGLSTAETLSGVTILIPTVADISELYAMRGALGSIAVSAAIDWTPEGRQSVVDALLELEACLETNDINAMNHLDQRFQNAIARSTSLGRVPDMLATLSQQVLMYVSIIGVHYAFPVRNAVTRNRQIFHAIDAKEQARAVEAWRTKIEESRAYMIRQLRQRSRRRPWEAPRPQQK